MIEYLPPSWVITLISSVATAFVGLAVGRRLYKATASEKEANASRTLASFANDLAERLDSTTKAMHQALGTVLQQELDRQRLDNQLLLTQNLAEERLKSIINLEGKLADVNHREPLGLDKAQIIREQAAVIVEECSHLSYLRSPDEEESVVERRFRAIKAAAKTIAELKI